MTPPGDPVPSGAGDRAWQCPLCGSLVEEGASPCDGCPIAHGCGVLCCPRCGYRCVERSWTLDLLSGLLRRLWPGRAGRKARQEMTR
jgi:hypothetical protein